MHTKKEKLKIYVTNNLDKIYRLAFSYAKNKYDAEDIVNESVKRALSAINSLREEKYLGTWFYRIVVNTAHTYMKSNSKIIGLDEIIEEQLTTEAKYEDFDLYSRIMNLEPEYREVIVLKYFEDKTFEKIAEILGENVNTVKTRTYSALKKLKLDLNEGEDLYE